MTKALVALFLSAAPVAAIAQGVATQTTLTSSSSLDPYPPFLSMPITFTANVTAAGTPTGTVTFKNDAAILCASVPLASGSAQCVASLNSFLATIVAEYSGDAGFAASASAPLTPVQRFYGDTAIIVNKAGTGTGSITSLLNFNSPCPESIRSCLFLVPFGASTTVNFWAAPGPGSLFSGWSGEGCSGTGSCLFVLRGDTTLTATFDEGAYPTATTLYSDLNPSVVGQAVNFEVIVDTTTNYDYTIPVGTVTFKADGSAICTEVPATPGNGSFASAKCNYSGLAEGTHQVVAEFSGSAYYLPSTSTAVTQLVQPPGPITLMKSGTAGGTVTSSPAGIDCGATCTASFPPGTQVTLVAVAEPGAVFSGWSPYCYGFVSTTCTVASGAATTVVATFHRPSRLQGISTRARVAGEDNVAIAGFVIDATAPKTVVIRARGPSLEAQGVASALADPVLTLVPSSGPPVTNDDWQTAANASELAASGFAPGHPKEAAILATLAPGGYTAILAGADGSTGIGIVEVYEIDENGSLIALSTRGRVATGDDAMIGGFIISEGATKIVVVRARGPSLTSQGVTGVLADPLLFLVSPGLPATYNWDWQQDLNSYALETLGFAPSHPLEAAKLVYLRPGAYTVIVQGTPTDSSAGIALVEVFDADGP